MTLLICSPASPGIAHLTNITRGNKEEYAHRWQCEAAFPVYHGVEMDHGFGRIAFMYEYLPRADWLLFMGADTMFMNMKTDMHQFCYDDADLVAAWDSMGLQSDVLFLRNCTAVERFLESVLAKKEETLKRAGFMSSSDQGAIVRTLSGRDDYFDSDAPISEQVIPVEQCQNGGLRVRQAPRRINSYMDTFRLGDDIFHCPGMSMEDKIRHCLTMSKQVIR